MSKLEYLFPVPKEEVEEEGEARQLRRRLIPWQLLYTFLACRHRGWHGRPTVLL
jgi:hypothetical protein